MADSTTGLPVSTSTDGDVVVGVEAGAVIGLDTAANTIKIDSSNNTIKIDAANNEITIAASQVVGIDGAANEITVAAAQVIGLDTAANTIKIDAANNEITVASGEVIGIATAANTIQISQTAGQNSIDIDSVNGTAITGANLPINIAAIGGTAPPVAGKIAIDGVNSTALAVTITGTAGVEKFDLVGPTAVAANLGTATVNFNDITVSTTGHLLRIEFFSQTQMRADIQTFDGTTAVSVSSSGTPSGGGAATWGTPGDNFITLAGGTNKHWRIIFTNLDKNKAADMYVTAFWSEV
jgi:hypothetical protein